MKSHIKKIRPIFQKLPRNAKCVSENLQTKPQRLPCGRSPSYHLTSSSFSSPSFHHLHNPIHGSIHCPIHPSTLRRHHNGDGPTDQKDQDEQSKQQELLILPPRLALGPIIRHEAVLSVRDEGALEVGRHIVEGDAAVVAFGVGLAAVGFIGRGVALSF